MKTTIIAIAFRELITIPHGGVAALPPSFLVNQLQDLMARWMTVLLLLTRMMVVMIKSTSVLVNQLQDLMAKLAVDKANKIILIFPRKGRESSPRCGDHPNQVRLSCFGGPPICCRDSFFCPYALSWSRNGLLLGDQTTPVNNQVSQYAMSVFLREAVKNVLADFAR